MFCRVCQSVFAANQKPLSRSAAPDRGRRFDINPPGSQREPGRKGEENYFTASFIFTVALGFVPRLPWRKISRVRVVVFRLFGSLPV